MIFFCFAIVVFTSVTLVTRSRVEYLGLLEPPLLPLLASRRRK